MEEWCGLYDALQGYVISKAMNTPEEFKHKFPITIGWIIFIMAVTAILISYYWKFNSSHEHQQVIEQRMDKRYERQQEVNTEFERRISELGGNHKER